MDRKKIKNNRIFQTTQRLARPWPTILFFWLASFAAPGQQLTPPLLQPPFDWKDFNTQKRYTSMKVNGKTIDSATVTPFLNRAGKGQVRQSLQNAILSGQPRIYPFEYQYEMQSSPDKRYFLIYRYDYSQPGLLVHLKVLNTGFSVIHTLQLPVMDNSVSHGYWIDNQGDIYAVYTDTEDAVYVMRYQPATNTTNWLEVGADVTRRNRFVPVFGADGILFLANISEDLNGKWQGVMITTFDFRKHQVTDLFFYQAENLKEKLTPKMPDGRYELIDFQATAQEKTVILQKIAIQANRYVYDPRAVHDPLHWLSRKQQVQYGEKITLRINADNKITSKVEESVQTKEF